MTCWLMVIIICKEMMLPGTEERKYGTQSMSQVLKQANVLAHELATAGRALPPDEFNATIIRNLGPDYAPSLRPSPAARNPSSLQIFTARCWVLRSMWLSITSLRPRKPSFLLPI